MRVMTWNLWWKFGLWEDRQAAIELELHAANADIVMLQEVYTNWSDAGVLLEDQAERVAGALGLQLARTLTDGGEPQLFGNAVLSRWPIRQSETVTLEDVSGAAGHRSALFVELETPWGLQLVICTHLEWRYDQSETRCRQLQMICVRIKTWMGQHEDGEDHLPPILAGDLNAVPESDELRRLRGIAKPFVEGLVFTDAWEATNGETGYTWTRENPNSPDAQWPNRRLDYVLIGWPRLSPQMNPLTTALGGVDPHSGVVASDHYAVVATLDERLPAARK